MSAHVCGCDPDHHTGAWSCADYPGCAYGRTLTRNPMPIPAALLALVEGLIAEHGPELVHRVMAQHPIIGVHPVKSPVTEEALPTHTHDFLGTGPCSCGEVQSPARVNLEEAWKLTHGNRKSSYGDVRISFARYAKIWSGLLGAKLAQELTASDVALLMTALKLAREFNKQQSDNVTDAHGYLILHDEIKEAERSAYGLNDGQVK